MLSCGPFETATKASPSGTGARLGTKVPREAGHVTTEDLVLLRRARDTGSALTFYRDVLSREVRRDVGSDKMRWVTIGPPSQPEFDIVLEPPGAEASPADRDLDREELPPQMSPAAARSAHPDRV